MSETFSKDPRGKCGLALIINKYWSLLNSYAVSSSSSKVRNFKNYVVFKHFLLNLESNMIDILISPWAINFCFYPFRNTQQCTN